MINCWSFVDIMLVNYLASIFFGMIITNLFLIYQRDIQEHVGRIRGKVWAKKITNINDQKTNGYAFEGEFIPFSKDQNLKDYDLKVGDIIITYVDEGSIRYHRPLVHLCRVEHIQHDDIKLEKVFEVEGYDWAKQILKDKELVSKIKEMLGKESYKEKLIKLIDNLSEENAKIIYDDFKDRIMSLTVIDEI